MSSPFFDECRCRPLLAVLWYKSGDCYYFLSMNNWRVFNYLTSTLYESETCGDNFMSNETNYNQNQWRVPIDFPNVCLGEDISVKNSFNIVWVRVHIRSSIAGVWFYRLFNNQFCTHIKALAQTFVCWLGTFPIHADTISFDIYLFEAMIYKLNIKVSKNSPSKKSISSLCTKSWT